MALSQIASTLGACLILVAYFALQTGRMNDRAYPYLSLNITGALLLLYAALVTRQAGFILLEAAWVLITLVGFARAFKKTT